MAGCGKSWLVIEEHGHFLVRPTFLAAFGIKVMLTALPAIYIAIVSKKKKGHKVLKDILYNWRKSFNEDNPNLTWLVWQKLFVREAF